MLFLHTLHNHKPRPASEYNVIPIHLFLSYNHCHSQMAHSLLSDRGFISSTDWNIELQHWQKRQSIFKLSISLGFLREISCNCKSLYFFTCENVKWLLWKHRNSNFYLLLLIVILLKSHHRTRSIMVRNWFCSKEIYFHVKSPRHPLSLPLFP